MMDINKMKETPLKATDPCDLERLIMDSNIAKHEAAWWAKREIESLRTQVAELKATAEYETKMRAITYARIDSQELKIKELDAILEYSKQQTREAEAERDKLTRQLAEANDDYKTVDALYRGSTDYGQAQHMELLEVRSQLAEYKDDAAPEGYVFLSADFSRQAAGHSQFGTVTFIRNKVGRQWWHELPEEQQEITSLHIYGKGTTVIEAMRHAAMKGATE